MPLRVLICQETLIVRDGLRSILEAEPDIEVLETTDSGFHAIMIIRSDHPDVVIVGISLRGISGLELLRRMHKENLDDPPRVVVFGMSFTDQMVTDMLRAGANGVLTGEASRDEVLATIRAVARGQTMLAPEVTERLVTWFRQHGPVGAARPAVPDLTPRERQVLLLIAQGLSTEDVARDLYIGISTVRTYLHRLRTKLDLKDRAQLVSFAYRAGLMASVPRDHAGPSAS
ncbi:MAG TPA: response regulator transcription factor [Streptosporangiaceae bacterium]